MNINLKISHQPNYYSRVRRWPLLFKLKNSPKILDIGCGQGQLGKLLIDNLNADVCGIEIFQDNIEKASSVLTQTILGDIESMDLSIIGKNYDYVIFSDSLEHLADPESVLKKAKTLLNTDGCLLISIPNVRNFRVTIPLLFNDSWEYTDEGLLDKTHLRFFTFTSIIKLLNKVGFDLEKYYIDLPLKTKVGVINFLSFGIFDKILTSHYFIKVCQREY
jgi:2-polyprenyl-3-methyl-5-hydroxy-6-metoxy-1,4-benzoquinol methylase